jgi:hypothetical protein
MALKESIEVPQESISSASRAAAVMHVVGVAVVGGAERDHGLELRPAQRRHLEPAESSPRDPDHPAGPGAPALLAEPAQHLHSVLLLLGQVLVGEQAVRLAAAADVHTHPGIAVAGQVGKARGVARRGAVALAVGDVVDHGRHRMLLGILGQPDAGPQP